MITAAAIYLIEAKCKESMFLMSEHLSLYANRFEQSKYGPCESRDRQH